jgi:nucleotide-binding universal stress UspA family protein
VIAASVAACGSPPGNSAADGGGANDGDATTALPPVSRDWVAHPPIAQLASAADIWALSDIHGDNAALTKLLVGANVEDAAGTWLLGSDVLVVIGDMIDKGPDAVDVIHTLLALQASAATAGGTVVITMGNHEAEFLAAPANSKAAASDGFDGELVAAGLSPTVTAAGGDDLGVTLRDLPFAALVDDWFFAHAGDTGGLTFAELSTALMTGVDADGFATPALADPDSLLEHHFSTSIFWEQAGGHPATTLATYATALGANHIVMGHEPIAVTFKDGVTRKADEMFQRYGEIFLIDTGMSIDVDATGGALLHIPNPADATSAEIVTPDGKRTPLVAK